MKKLYRMFNMVSLFWFLVAPIYMGFSENAPAAEITVTPFLAQAAPPATAGGAKIAAGRSVLQDYSYQILIVGCMIAAVLFFMGKTQFMIGVLIGTFILYAGPYLLDGIKQVTQ